MTSFTQTAKPTKLKIDLMHKSLKAQTHCYKAHPWVVDKEVVGTGLLRISHPAAVEKRSQQNTCHRAG